jgi:hypothetical protein
VNTSRLPNQQRISNTLQNGKLSATVAGHLEEKDST